jgi:hypothetical protein
VNGRRRGEEQRRKELEDAHRLAEIRNAAAQGRDCRLDRVPQPVGHRAQIIREFLDECALHRLSDRRREGARQRQKEIGAYVVVSDRGRHRSLHAHRHIPAHPWGGDAFAITFRVATR